jgi:ATP-binding cassette subfamily B protein
MPADQRGMIRKAMAAGWTTLKARLSRLGQTLALVWRCSPSLTLSLSLLTLLGVVLPLLVAYVGKALVDAVVAHQQAAALRLVGVELG